MLLTVVSIALFVAGAAIVIETVASAIRTFVLPRSANDPITTAVFWAVRQVFALRLRWARTYSDRDRLLAMYAPVALMVLVPVWLNLILLGYIAMYWATGAENVNHALVMSGSSLLTLGFERGDNAFHTWMIFSEATLGLMLIAILIAYLPTMYGAFSRREVAVTQLSSRAGTPPSAEEMIVRAHRIGQLSALTGFWAQWEGLFAEMEESHTSLAPMVYFRSPHPDQSWITASGAVLDAASVILSAVDLPRDPYAPLCIRAGFLALHRIAEFLRIEFNPDPHYPDEPISIDRSEFDALCDSLARQGVPMKADRDQAWQDFAGWRVNYDRVLLALCSLVMAPYALWSSDRSNRLRPTAKRIRRQTMGRALRERSN